jgi:hypothetical protein
MSLFAVSPSTVIQDTVYNADGSPFNGSIVIGWPTFQRADGTRVQGGSRSVDVQAGAFRASLPVFNGYSVLYLDSSATERRETWSVPASATTLRIQDVRTNRQEDANATSIQGITVDAATPGESDALFYDPASRKWVPKKAFARPTTYAGLFDALSYAEGTISVDGGSRLVTGNATAWDATMVGWFLVSGGTVAQVDSVDSPTRITLSSAWPGADVSGEPYFLGRAVTIPGTTHQLGTASFSVHVYRYDPGSNWTEVVPYGTSITNGTYDVGILLDRPALAMAVLQR